MEIHTLPRWRTKESRSSFELFLYGLLCLGVAACGGGDDPMDVDADDPCQATSSISLGQSRPGQLDATDCVLSDLLSDGAFGDRWSLSLAGQTDVRIDLTSNTFDAFLELRDNVGNVIALNDNAAGSFDARLIRTLQAGSYIILARTLEVGQAGAYRLSVTDGPDCSPVGALQLGQTVTGGLADDDCVGEITGQVDNWSLSLANTLKLRIDLESSDFDEVVLVQNQEGDIIDLAVVGPTGHARLDTELEAGEWTIVATAPLDTGRGAYDLTVDELPACTPGTDFVLGETVAGDISPSDCLVAFVAPADSFVINITEEAVISIHLKSLDFQPFLILLDANGIVVAAGEDEMGDGNARIREALSPGSYALFATTASLPGEGSYLLTVSQIACDDPQPIAFGQTVDGALDDNDCLRPGGAFQESWELVLANDTTARIDLESAPAFDAFLVLKDSDGTILAEDDDGSGGLDARIERALTAGTYEIVASSRNANETGAYQLKVDVPPPATTPPAGTERARAP